MAKPMTKGALNAWAEREKFAVAVMEELDALPMVNAERFAAREPHDAPWLDLLVTRYEEHDQCD